MASQSQPIKRLHRFEPGHLLTEHDLNLSVCGCHKGFGQAPHGLGGRLPQAPRRQMTDAVLQFPNEWHAHSFNGGDARAEPTSLPSSLPSRRPVAPRSIR
jgi:hypothetical protein